MKNKIIAFFKRKVQRVKDLYYFKHTLEGNEFHQSLDFDVSLWGDMTKEEKRAYEYDLIKRRNLAHEMDLEK